VKNLEEAVNAHRSALRYFDFEKSPSDWALTQSYLGDAFIQLGIAKGDSGLLEAGVEAYRSTLKGYTFETSPLEWARSKNYLGNALVQLAMANEAVRVKNLEEAVDAHRSALRYFDSEKLPSEWALTQNYLGFALGQLSLTESGSSLNSLEEAVKAHQAALKVFTFEKFPLDWAKTQSYLGYVLGFLGAKIEGKKGLPTIQAAIDAHRASLKVHTFDKFPNEWVASQNNLGYALYLLGERYEGEPRMSAIREAIEAHRSVLRAHTFETTPPNWLRAQYQLVNDYLLLADWTQAEGIYLEILARVPSDVTAYNGAVVMYHERTFQFDKAFDLTRRWLEQNPNDLSGQLNLAENSLTTERFDDCEKRIDALVSNAQIDANNRVALRAIQIANLLALKKDDQIKDLVEAMVLEVTNQAADFRVSWGFAGTTHFVSLNKNLASHQSWLKNLFEALGQPDRDSILRALMEVKKKFKSSAAVRLPAFRVSDTTILAGTTVDRGRHITSSLPNSYPLELTHENDLHCFEVNRSHTDLRCPA
jgi:tetratricopeptide (TPR) repeat protein